MLGVALSTGHTGGGQWPLTVALTLAAAASAVLLGLALSAFLRRRSRPYLLVVLALAALVGQPLVGFLFTAGALGDRTHHLLEHGLDVTLSALVVGAVWYARDRRGGERP